MDLYLQMLYKLKCSLNRAKSIKKTHFPTIASILGEQFFECYKQWKIHFIRHRKSIRDNQRTVNVYFFMEFVCFGRNLFVILSSQSEVFPPIKPLFISPQMHKKYLLRRNKATFFVVILHEIQNCRTYQFYLYNPCHLSLDSSFILWFISESGGIISYSNAF